MIPDVITEAHLKRAAAALVTEDIPKRHRSTKYDVSWNGRLFPPKYLIARALKEATGRTVSTRGFSGGREANTFLRKRGFAVVDKRGRPIS